MPKPLDSNPIVSNKARLLTTNMLKMPVLGHCPTQYHRFSFHLLEAVADSRAVEADIIIIKGVI
jgi:hypothetical protein